MIDPLVIFTEPNTLHHEEAGHAVDLTVGTDGRGGCSAVCSCGWRYYGALMVCANSWPATVRSEKYLWVLARRYRAHLDAL